VLGLTMVALRMVFVIALTIEAIGIVMVALGMTIYG
jgi:hypothetical protein